MFFFMVYSCKMFLLQTFVPGSVGNCQFLHVVQDLGDSLYVRHNFLCLIMASPKNCKIIVQKQQPEVLYVKK